MAKKQAGYRGRVRHLFEGVVGSIMGAWFDSITLKMRRGKSIRKYILPIYGMGFNGGPIDAHKLNEIVLRNGRIIGFRNYAEGKEQPLQSLNEIVWEDGCIKEYSTGRKVESFHEQYDSRFTGFGSAYLLTNDDYAEEGLGDLTNIQGEIMDDALRYYMKLGKRKLLGYHNGEKIEVIEIPRTYTLDEFWKDVGKGHIISAIGNYIKSLSRGFDGGLATYFLAQTGVYKIMDVLFYDPIVEKLYKGLKKTGNIRLDPFMRAQYIKTTDIVNNLMGLESNIDSLYHPEFA